MELPRYFFKIPLSVIVILLAFTIRPVAGFITMIANLFFQDVTTNTMTQKVMQSLGLSVFTTAFLPGLVEEILFRGVLYSRLIKRRTVANEACSAGRVLVNGKAAKAGTNVKPGDRIDIQFGNRETAVEVVSIAETVKKDEAADLYKFL